MAFGSCLVIHCEYWRGTMDTMLPCTPEAEIQQAETSVWVPATRADAAVCVLLNGKKQKARPKGVNLAAGVSACIRRSSHWARDKLNICLSRAPSRTLK